MISAGIGFALGFFIGVPVAFLMAWYRPVRYILEPWIRGEGGRDAQADGGDDKGGGGGEDNLDKMAGEARDIKVQIKGVEKIYEGRNGKTVALNGVDLDICENEFICDSVLIRMPRPAMAPVDSAAIRVVRAAEIPRRMAGPGHL